MEARLEDNLKQSSQAMPTIEEVKNWDAEELLEWIKENRPQLLRGDTLKKFKAEEVSGEVFLRHACNLKFFKEGCKLPAGPSDGLAYLASEIIGKQSMGTKVTRFFGSLYTNLYYCRAHDKEEKESASRRYSAFTKENPSRQE